MEQNEITAKELFERLIRLETLMGEKNKLDAKITKRFTLLATLLLLLTISNIVVHIYFR